jgi:hypothetical protein
MLAEFGHASANYADERFSIQTRSSLSYAYTPMLSLFKNYATKCPIKSDIVKVDRNCERMKKKNDE